MRKDNRKVVTVKVAAPNTPSGNPQRGWIVMNKEGRLITFIEEHYDGYQALTNRFPNATLGPVIETKASEYHGWVRAGKRMDDEIKEGNRNV